MMPPKTTFEDIKAHQRKVEKDKITPDNLSPCPRCRVGSEFFKIHAYCERRFLIIIEMLIKAAYCSLVRFRCPGCGKTFTDYPDFAIPHKHYTRPTFTGFSTSYVESENMTYQQAVMVDNSAPGYPESDSTDAPTLAPTTIHRWITTLGCFTQTCRTALILLLQENPLSNSWPEKRSLFPTDESANRRFPPCDVNSIAISRGDLTIWSVKGEAIAENPAMSPPKSSTKLLN